MKLFKLPATDEGECIAVNPYDVVMIHLKVAGKKVRLEIDLSTGKGIGITFTEHKPAMLWMDQLIEASDSAKEVAPEETAANTPE